MFHRSGVLLALAATAVLATTAAAHAAGRLYFERGHSIAALDTARSGHVVTVVPRAGAGITGISVGGGHVFWLRRGAGSASTGTLWRAGLDGRGARPIVSGVGVGVGTAVAGSFIYWIDANGISRAALNGSHVHRRLVALVQENGGGVAEDLATDGDHLYFSRCQDGTIGRVDADGGDLRMRFIYAGNHACPQGLAVGGRSIYWTTNIGSALIPALGRADIDGTDVRNDWLRVGGELGPYRVAADRSSVYWSHSVPESEGGAGFIGRVRSDGTHLTRVIATDPGIYSLALGG